jgi:N-acetylmuramoyl-L-alanine amidase
MVRRVLRVVCGLVLLALGSSCGGTKQPATDGPEGEEHQAPSAPAGSVPAPDTSNESPTPTLRLGTICIDAGHGGRDSGTVAADGTEEQALTLDIARRIRDGLEAKGATVVMTREEDRSVSVEQRAARCNGAGAGLFVSIHVNSFDTHDVRGFEVFYYDGHTSAASGRAAEAIRRALADAPDTHDRGVRRAGYGVLLHTKCPAVLVEVGYMTNPGELARLEDDAYRQRLADAVVAGVVAFVEAEAAQPAEGEQ